MKELLRRIACLGRRSRFDEELDAEVRSNIDTRADELEQSGMPRDTAIALVRREFGSSGRMREDTRSRRPDYFRTMQIAILAGREFLPADRPGGQASGIVNKNMARRLGALFRLPGLRRTASTSR